MAPPGGGGVIPGWDDGVAEFDRRERPGFDDVKRIFGTTPTCYGQPGSSWAPQSNAALRRMGIPMYLDEGLHVGIGEQPFWYGGLLYVFNMGRFQLRAPLNGAEPLEKTFTEPLSASWLTIMRLAPPNEPASQPVARETPPR